jgi:F0F1-type ATP synthase assembly protein I
MNPYRVAVLTFGLVAVGLGIGILVETAIHGGGVGYVIGLLFLGLGAGRLYLLRRK